MSARFYFLAMFLANLGLQAITYFMLPEKVAIHFGADGAADGWASRDANLLIWLGLNLVLFPGLYFSARWMRKLPSALVSLPNKDYWMSEEHREEMVRIMDDRMMGFGAVLYFFLFFTGLMTLQANFSDPAVLDVKLFLLGLGLFLGYTVFWTIGFYRTFRVPESTS